MNIMRNKIYYALLVMLFSFSLVACGINGNSEQHNNEESELVEKGGGDLSSMYGGNYARILCEDFGLKEHIAIDIGAVLEAYSCDVDEVYEVVGDGENGYYITYKDVAGTTWEKQHLIMSEGTKGYWLVEEPDCVAK